VNVEIARGQEGILLRYWNDIVSDEEAQNLADTIAKVFTVPGCDFVAVHIRF
jgi:hypothetical protein